MAIAQIGFQEIQSRRKKYGVTLPLQMRPVLLEGPSAAISKYDPSQPLKGTASRPHPIAYSKRAQSLERRKDNARLANSWPSINP